MGFGYPQICQQMSYRLGLHAGTPIRVQRELLGLDVLFVAAVPDQGLGQAGCLSVRDHPAHHIAAVDIENDVEIEVGPGHRAFEFRYVPGPDLIRCCSQELRFGIVNPVGVHGGVL